MTYKYYCVDCGNEIPGEEINFDLADLLGIRIGNDNSSVQRGLERDEKGNFKNFVKRKTTQISARKLMALAEKHNVPLKHGVRSFLKITLKEFLTVMGENEGGEVLAQEMRSKKYSELREALELVFQTSENRIVEEKLIKDWLKILEERFHFNDEANSTIAQQKEEGKDSDPEIHSMHMLMMQNTTNYEAGFWIEPEFFGSSSKQAIYTVRYSLHNQNAFMENIHEPMTIRGFCPRCGQPVIEGAGKYPHELVGLLGVQSSGKTSMIMAIIKELQDNFGYLGISYPGAPLCDSRYHIMMLNKELYDNGWAVEKTNASSNEGSFNISLKISDKDNRTTKLVTFVDIAGEQCYDIRNHQVNQEALQKYPVIGQCKLYILCSCIDKTGYGNADGERAIIPENALIQIATTIYERLLGINKTTKIPPLCILMTKADMSPKPVDRPSATNPFRNIKTPEYYLYKNQLDNLVRAYDMTDEKNIRDPLDWCGKTYDEIAKFTYVSMMSCSALGRSGVRYEGDLQNIVPFTDKGEPVGFRRVRIAILCKWIMEVLGLKTIDEMQYLLPYIPSYREYYTLDNNAGKDGYFTATEEDMKLRIMAIMKLFINHSPLDQAILNEFNRENGRWLGSTLSRRLKKVAENSGFVYRR